MHNIPTNYKTSTFYYSNNDFGPSCHISSSSLVLTVRRCAFFSTRTSISNYIYWVFRSFETTSGISKWISPVESYFRGRRRTFGNFFEILSFFHRRFFFHCLWEKWGQKLKPWYIKESKLWGLVFHCPGLGQPFYLELFGDSKLFKVEWPVVLMHGLWEELETLWF